MGRVGIVRQIKPVLEILRRVIAFNLFCSFGIVQQNWIKATTGLRFSHFTGLKK